MLNWAFGFTWRYQHFFFLWTCKKVAVIFSTVCYDKDSVEMRVLELSQYFTLDIGTSLAELLLSVQLAASRYYSFFFSPV